MNERNENIRYALLISLNTMMLCSGLGFTTYYLLDAQVDDSSIGILISVSCLVAVLLQQIFGRAVDTGRAEGKKILLFLDAIMIVAAIFVLFADSSFVKAIIFGSLLCLTLTMQPILNAFTFFYQSHRISVNYGIARGCGSLSFAIMSIIIGFLTVQFGSVVVPLSYVIFCVAFCWVTISMPNLRGNNSNTKSTRTLQLSQFPAFCWMLAGLSLVMIFHNAVQMYFIRLIEHVGGDTGDLGVALAIAAVVEIPALFLYTRIKGNTPSKIFLAISGVAFFIKAALFLLASQIWMIFAVQLVQFLAYGIMVGGRVYWVNETISPAFQVTAQAYVVATETIGIVLGSILGGFIMEIGGINALLWFGTITAFLGMLSMIHSANYKVR